MAELNPGHHWGNLLLGTLCGLVTRCPFPLEWSAPRCPVYLLPVPLSLSPYQRPLRLWMEATILSADPVGPLDAVP